jgi:hypothetical protein
LDRKLRGPQSGSRHSGDDDYTHNRDVKSERRKAITKTDNSDDKREEPVSEGNYETVQRSVYQTQRVRSHKTMYEKEN